MADVTPGEKRWTIMYGVYEGIEHQAILEVYRGMQFYVNYVIPLQEASKPDPARCEHVLLMGTAASNPRIADLIAKKVIPAPAGPESYTLWVGNSPANAENRLTVIAGADPVGVLYGVQDLLSAYSAESVALDKGPRRRAALAKLADRSLVESPAVKERGIWTWGYVIYDYRRFLDNMVRLRMNMLTIWNSEAPLNLTEVCEYAHKRGIKIIAGFNWGWGLGKDISTADGVAFIKQFALDQYRKEYAHVPIDGIYFQSETEHKNQILNGRSVAAWCCDMVNEITAEFYKISPDLSIQFGLHASSIRDNYVDLAKLDPRVIITWEDAGALPFSYFPDSAFGDGYEATLEYSKKLAAFRPGSQFAMVPKGWMSLRWDDEFGKYVSFMMGERDPAFLRERMITRQGEWNSINAGWYKHYPLAARFYREVLAINPNVLSTGLVEDVMFDAKIQPSVAMLGEMLWNPHRSDADLLERSMRPYVNITTV